MFLTLQPCLVPGTAFQDGQLLKGAVSIAVLPVETRVIYERVVRYDTYLIRKGRTLFLSGPTFALG